MEKENRTYETIKDFYEKRNGNKESSSEILTFFSCVVICLGLYFLFSDSTPPKKAPTTTEIIQQEKSLRSIFYDKKANEQYQTNVELYQTELKTLQNKIAQLNEEKKSLIETVESRKNVLKHEMLLKQEIKEIELSQANGQGYEKGYSDGLRRGNSNSNGSFGAGLILGHIFTKK